MSAVEPLAASFAYCRKLTRETAHNFRYSFLTLPRRQYDAMCALYAFMRIADDCSDDERLTVAERRAAVANWAGQLQQGLQGAMPTHPAWPAILTTIRQSAIPVEYLEAVLQGVARDLDPVRIETFAELEDYCYHVAGAVGLCCLHIWGFRDAAAIPLGIECGLALQLTNILRDVAEDAQRGRIYLPTEDCQRFGVTKAMLMASSPTAEFRALMAFEVQRARACYERSAALFPLVDPVGRPILRAMRSIYGALLDEIERRDYDVLTERVSVPRWKKLWFVAQAWWTGARLPAA